MYGRKTKKLKNKQNKQILVGGDQRYRSHRVTRGFSSKLKKVINCFHEFIVLIANLIYEKQKLLQITNIISEEFITHQGVRKEKYLHILRTKQDWDVLFRKDNRRIPNDTMIDKRLLSNDEDRGRGTGILDIARHEKEEFLGAADKLLTDLRNATNQREIDIVYLQQMADSLYKVLFLL